MQPSLDSGKKEGGGQGVEGAEVGGGGVGKGGKKGLEVDDWASGDAFGCVCVCLCLY